MGKPIITSQLKQLRWPQNQPLDDYQLVRQAQMRAYELQGNASIDLTSRISFNHGAVDIARLGEYQTVATVVDDAGNSAEYRVTITIVAPQSMPQQGTQPTQPQTPTTAPQPSKAHSKKPWLVACVILAVLLLGFFGLRSCHNQKAQQANNAAQSSQISQNSQSIAKLKRQNSATRNQLKALQQAVQDYQQDQNQQALQSQLNDLKAQNAALKTQVQTQLDQQRLWNLNNAIDNISSHPDQAGRYLDNVEDNAVFSTPWSDYLNNVERWANWN